jgi:hypothetical protein
VTRPSHRKAETIPRGGVVFLSSERLPGRWGRDVFLCSNARAGSYNRTFKPQNSRDFRDGCGRFILIFLPGWSLPRFGGAFLSGQAEPNPGVPNCPAAEDGNPSARGMTLKAPSRGIGWYLSDVHSAGLLVDPLVRIPMLGLVNHLARRDRIRGERPRRGRNDQRHRKNRPEHTFDCMWLKCHDSPPGCAASDLRGAIGRRCVSYVTLRWLSKKMDLRTRRPLGARSAPPTTANGMAACNLWFRPKQSTSIA